MKELLELRLERSKTSIKKYEAMARTVCRDGRVYGMLQFGGASRTFRWAGRLVQLQNAPQNHLPDLRLVRSIVKSGGCLLYTSWRASARDLCRMMCCAGRYAGHSTCAQRR